jgi:pyridoxine 4-dehydrogenase
MGSRRRPGIRSFTTSHSSPAPFRGIQAWVPLNAGTVEGGPIEDVARAHDATAMQVALAWLLQHSPVMLPIPGTSSRAHLEQNVATASLRLSEAEREQLAA